MSLDHSPRRTAGTRAGALVAACLAALVHAVPAAAQPARASGPAFTLQQTLSDEAQRNTIAFDCLAFLTGSLGADSFFPPGKVADFWGFQYLRDNDPSALGHNTDFLTRAAENVLFILGDRQRSQLLDLAARQVQSNKDYALRRFPLMDAFRRLLAGDLPRGTTGLDLSAVNAYSAQLYRLDGEISLERAEVMGRIVQSLDARQRQYLDGLVGQGMASWPDPGEQLDKRSLPHDVHVAVMTYAGDLFAWYAGSLEADTYFCPERQGTYFGSFYLKDAPAVGNPNYTIDANLTANMGRNLLAALDASQARLVSGLVEAQKPALYELVDVRRAIATELRRFTTGDTADAAAVLRLAERYGELDGEIVFSYATSFAAVGQSLTAEQRANLLALRRQLGDFTPKGAYLYADPIDVPLIGSTDFLFGAGRGGSTR